MPDLDTLINRVESNLEPSIKALAKQPELDGLSPKQRVLFALTIRTFQEYNRHRHWLATVSFLPAVIIILGGLFYWMMSLLGLCLKYLSGLVGESVFFVMYLVSMTICLLPFLLRFAHHTNDIRFLKTKDKVNGLQLGRLDDIFTPGATHGYVTVLCIALVSQVAILRFTPEHGGLAIEGGLKESILLTLDNLCHGIFLDTFELYNINLHEKITHTPFSATVFYFFRLTFDGMIALMLFVNFRKIRMLGLLKSFPEGELTPYALSDWLDQLCRQGNFWPRQYFEEFMFLLLTSRYLQNDFDFIWKLTNQFPRLPITQEVRYLFAQENGNPALVFTEDG
jgi:hypothetical protein